MRPDLLDWCVDRAGMQLAIASVWKQFIKVRDGGIRDHDSNSDTACQLGSTCHLARYGAFVNDLRQRRREETKRTLFETAFTLFAERGFDNVTMEEVAAAAGMSRSTAYRRFPTKEDVVLEVPTRWQAEFDAAASKLPDDTTADQAIEAVSLAVAQHIDANRDTVLAAYTILDQSPSLQRSSATSTAWPDRLSALVTRFADVDDETAALIAGAYMGAIDAMMQHWAASGGASQVTAATTRLLRRLAPILPSDAGVTAE